MENILLLKIVKLLHKLVVYFIIFGFLLPKKYLYLHALSIPILKLHWYFNNDKCILTQLEYKLSGKKNDDVPLYTDDHDYPYIKNMLGSYSTKFTNTEIHDIIIKIIISSWLITMFRLYN